MATKEIPIMLIRMRCPACLTDLRFGVEPLTPLEHLPELCKAATRCRCNNHIPKINRNTSLDNSLMSINGVPLRDLKDQVELFRMLKSFKPIDADLN
jgi:hypothetical protein